MDIAVNTKSIPIGELFPTYRYMILDEFLQSIIIDQQDQLALGGVDVFKGYLPHDDLTKKVLIEIDGEIFYRTGDIVRMTNSGLLHPRGRKDHQIKLYGQRIELGETEQFLLNTSIIMIVFLLSRMLII